jgi:NAD+ synthase (glutamine-hydrolysing)
MKTVPITVEQMVFSDRTLRDFGMLRLAVVAPEHRVADVAFNVERMRECVEALTDEGCRLLVFPELGLTAYTCADLFFQPLLLQRAQDALFELAELTRSGLILVVGLPVAQGGRLFNCAAVLADGAILGVIPKTHLPNSAEFYDERWFSAAADVQEDILTWRGQTIPFGADLLFRCRQMPDCLLGVEICEDAWVAEPPSGRQALRGATLLVNLSASPETLGKADYRRDLVRMQSARCLAAYAYASAGPGESSTDLVFSGHGLIAENGVLLAESERFAFSSRWALADIDVERLVNERRRNNTFADAQTPAGRMIDFDFADTPVGPLCRPLSERPFVPAATADRKQRCQEIFALQTTGLARRLRHTGTKTAVIGISGGLDSTLALLVAVKAFDRLGLDRAGIRAVTMPGFGTTRRTHGNAETLAQGIGVTLQTVSIHAAVSGHFQDIGHPPDQHDLVFENAQARERTQILMDIANQTEGLVIGTGDLSELALGWCTYNADHMSMYGVNCGVPKTLVRYLVEWCAEEEFSGAVATTLHDICATPVSPELLPPDAAGDICQKTEEQVGPYLLHDFFLYHIVRLQFGPDKVFFLATTAFSGQFEAAEILHWLENFYRRFFSQQFKRSCLPDGPKVGSVALSPRGDWRMPSDASCTLWLERITVLRQTLGLNG